MIPACTLISSRQTQSGFVLLPVVLALVLMAVIAFMLNNQGALEVGSGVGEAEAKRANYLASTGLEHATWGLQNSACAGDMSMTSVPFGQGSDTYSATVTTGGSTTAYSLSADQDAWFRSDNTTNNNGTAVTHHLRMELGNLEYTVIRFDLSSLPANAQINSATAWFYVKGTKGHPEGPVTVHQTNADWTEADATWDSMASNYNNALLNTIPAQPTAGDNWIQVNLTAQLQSWVNGQPNYGIMLIPVGEGTHAEYISREGVASQQPKLEVIVGSGAASPAVIAATGTLANGVTRTLTRNQVQGYQGQSNAFVQFSASVGEDALFDNFYSNRNFGGANYLQVSADSGYINQALLKFELGKVPAGSHVVAAKLELKLKSLTAAGTVSVFRPQRRWVEGTKTGGGTADGVTWNTYDGTNAWTQAGGDYDSEPVSTSAINSGDSWVDFDIAPLVRDWLAGQPNNGLLLVGNAPLDDAKFESRQTATVGDGPRVTITYACECGSACLAPQGSGNVLMVVGDPTIVAPSDTFKKALFESWGYTVNLQNDDAGQTSFNSKFTSNDVVYVSETSVSASVGTKLTNASIGVVNEQGNLNDELGIATAKANPIGASINVTDNSHYITWPFTSGSLNIYSANMEGLTVSGTEAPGLQTLADWGGAGSLVVLDQGMQIVGGGTAAGRRVMLPLGRSTNSNFNWDYLNGNGRLIVQRALQWGTGNIGPIVSDQIILSTNDAASLGGLNFTDIDLADYDPDADTASLLFEGALTTLNTEIDAVHILANGHILLSTKDADTLGGLNFLDGDLVDYDPGTDTATLYFDEFAFSADEDIVSVYLMSNGHLVLSTDSAASLGGLSFTDKDLVEYDSSTDTATLFFNGGATTLSSDIDAVHVLDNGHIVLSTKVATTLGGLSFGDGDLVDYDPATDTAVLYFDEGLFSADEDIISAHIGVGSGTLDSGTLNLLLVVVDPSALTLQETRKKDLIESWGYSVNLIDVNDSQAAFDTAVAANDVVFITEDISSGDLNTKLVNATIGVVTEEDNLSDEFGLSQSIGWESGTLIEVNDNTHYITSPFPLGILTIASTSESLAYVTGTLAPDLGQLASTTSGFGLVTLETGGSMYGGGNAAGRRVQLPWGGDDFDINNLNADGRTLMQRALEWGAGAVTAPIAHWKLDDGVGTTAIDSEGGHDGTLINGPVWNASGQTDGSLDFDEVDDYVQVPDFDFGIDFTVSFGIRVDDNTGSLFQYMYSHGDINGVNSLNVFLNEDSHGTDPNMLRTVIRDENDTLDNTALEFDASSIIGDGNWHTYTLTVANGAGANVYLDGVLQNADSRGGDAFAPSTDIYLGARQDLDTSRLYGGSLDNVRVYDYALSATEVAALAAEAGSGGGGGGGGCDGTFRDEFNERLYGENDGTLIWNTEWEETGETTSPTGGDIQIANDTSNYQLRVRDDGQTVMREANLSAAASATLSFDYRRENLSGSSDYVAVEVSYNGGSSWAELDRFIGTADDGSYTSTSYALDAGSLSATTRIRFLTPTSGMANSNMVLFDNVQILCTP